MDVSDILASQAAKHKSILVEKDIPLDIDTGFLTVTDTNPTDKESYDHDREAYLQATARDGVQLLLAALFSLPTLASPDGPLAQLPAPTTQLPRAKPLPKPKPPTKWEKFARAKGIQAQRRERKVWDDERQEWVARWGWKGANKDAETQWLHEVPANADVDHDPAKEARAERKARVAKNERQHLQNVARAQGGAASSGAGAQAGRKGDIERSLATTRVSTASMGKFDRTLEGEKKPRGMKRKFDPTEKPVESEKSANLALIKKLGSDPSSKKARREAVNGEGDVLNVRKAVRFASKGAGSAALARKSSATDGKKRKAKR
ncbi:ribosome biogenesis regulatory protein-domain-containing protein [Gloeopeniophorella convolvens]|nr:ribosome biogenesis regulatory protein-domain-containing protein [Gloeopeniophorella convolvens]